MPARLLLVRHGRTSWNRDGRWQGHAGPGLDDLGRRQAHAVAGHLAARVRSDAVTVVCSDLERAVQTAEPVAAALGVVHAVDERLREIDVGAWTGCTHDEVDVTDPWSRDPGVAFGGHGESVDDLSRRVGAWLADVDTGDRAVTVAVTHGGVVRAAVARVLGVSRPWLVRSPDNTGVTRMEWSGDHGVWRLATHAEGGHVPHE